MSNDTGLNASNAPSVAAAASAASNSTVDHPSSSTAAVAPAPEAAVSAATSSHIVHSDSDSDSDCSSDDDDDADAAHDKGVSTHRKLSSDTTPRGSTAATVDGKRKKKGDKGSCHQCKTIRETKFLLGCTSKAEKGKRKRKCRKRYCAPCLQRTYSQTLGNMTLEEVKTWQCPSCRGICTCAACQRRSMMTSVVESIPLALTPLGMLPVPLGVNGLPLVPIVPAPHQLLNSQAGFVDPYFPPPLIGLPGMHVPPALGGLPGIVAPPAGLSLTAPPIPLLPFIPPFDPAAVIPPVNLHPADRAIPFVDPSLPRQPFTIPAAKVPTWLQQSSPSPHHGPVRSVDPYSSPHHISPTQYASQYAAPAEFQQQHATRSQQRINQAEPIQQYQPPKTGIPVGAIQNPSFAAITSPTHRSAPTSADGQEGLSLKSNTTPADPSNAPPFPLSSHHLSRTPVAKLFRLESSDGSHDTLSYRWPNAPNTVPRRTRTIQANQESSSRPNSSNVINTTSSKSVDEDMGQTLHQSHANGAPKVPLSSTFDSNENPRPSPDMITPPISINARSSSDRQQVASTSGATPPLPLPIPPSSHNNKPHSSHAFSFTTMRDRRLSETNRSVSSDQLPNILRGSSRSGASSVGSGGSVIDSRVSLNSPLGTSMADALVGLDLSRLEPSVLKVLHDNLQVQLERRGMTGSVSSSVDRHSSTSNNSDNQPPHPHHRSMSYDGGSMMTTDEPNQTILNASVSPVQRTSGGRNGAYSASSAGSSGGRRDSSRKRKQPATLSHGQYAADSSSRPYDAFYSPSPSSPPDRSSTAPTPNTVINVAQRRLQVMEKLRGLQGSNRAAMEAIGIKNLDSLDLTHLSLPQLDALVVLLTPNPLQQQVHEASQRSQSQQSQPQQRISPEYEQSPNSPFDPVRKRQNSDSKDLSDRSTATPQLNQMVPNPSTSPTIRSPAYVHANNGLPPQPAAAAAASHQYIPSQQPHSGLPASPTSPASKTLMLQQQLQQLESQLQELQQQQMRFQLSQQQAQQQSMASSSNHMVNQQHRYAKTYSSEAIDSLHHEQQQELLRRQQQRLLRHQLQQQSARLTMQQQQQPSPYSNHSQEAPVNSHYMHDPNAVVESRNIHMPPHQSFHMPPASTNVASNSGNRLAASHHVNMNMPSNGRPTASHSNLSLNTSALAMTSAMFSPFDDGMTMINDAQQPMSEQRRSIQPLLSSDPNNPLRFLSPQLQQTTPPASSIQTESDNRPPDSSTASTSQCMSTSPIKHTSPSIDNVVGRLPIAANPPTYLQNGLITPSPIDPLNYPRSALQTSSSYPMYSTADLSMDQEDFNTLN